MADCNSIESLLNELLDKLNNGDGTPYDTLAQLIFRLTQRVDNLERINAFTIPKLLKRTEDLEKLLKSGDLNSRLKRVELQIKSQIAFTAKLNTFAKKTDNDFRYAVKKWSERFADIAKKFTELDKKNVDQDKKNSDQDTAISALQAAVAGLLLLGAKIAALIAKQTALDTAIDQLKKLPPPKQGQKGDKGDKGDTGSKGDKGQTGSKGDKGDKGDRGEAGAKGSKGDKGDQGQTGAKGDRGQTGQKGDKGSKGDKGDQGEAGLKGDKGDQGETGLKGDKGDQGETGLKGDKGDQGLNGQAGAKGDKGDKGDEGQVTIVEKEVTKLVYQQPDFTEVLAKILELRQKLIFNSTVEISTDCGVDPVAVNTTDLPSFLNAIEDKLGGLESLICQNPELEAYQLGNFTEPSTVTLEDGTRFIKVSVSGFPDGISRRFGRSTGQPNNYPFGFVAFESEYGLYPEANWEWINSYFYPDKEIKATKFHVYSNYPNINYSITGFKVKP